MSLLIKEQRLTDPLLSGQFSQLGASQSQQCRHPRTQRMRICV